VADERPLSGEELAALGLLDPAAPDAEDRLELIRFAMARGATVDDVARAINLGELALDFTLRPRSGRTLGEVAAASGLSWASAERLLAATGLPVDPDQQVSEEEAATLSLLATVSDLLGEDATVQLGRVAGQAMARVAEAVVTSFRLRYELPRRSSGAAYATVIKEYAEITQTVLPGFVRSLDVLLRQQILAVAERMWSTDDDRSAVTLPRTIGFADLVGYTAASATMTVPELTAVLLSFDERTAAAALGANGQIVKTIGDEAMFVAERAADACRIALALVEVFGRDGMPAVRVGLAAGDVVSMFGDVYGPDVNLAARLVKAAEPSTVVVSGAVAAACADSFRFEPLGSLTLKGFAEPIPTHRLVGTRT
jgi:adenylate cyclase